MRSTDMLQSEQKSVSIETDRRVANEETDSLGHTTSSQIQSHSSTSIEKGARARARIERFIQARAEVAEMTAGGGPEPSDVNTPFHRIRALFELL
jgi:hypothetical protein